MDEHVLGHEIAEALKLLSFPKYQADFPQAFDRLSREYEKLLRQHIVLGLRNKKREPVFSLFFAVYSQKPQQPSFFFLVRRNFHTSGPFSKYSSTN